MVKRKLLQWVARECDRTGLLDGLSHPKYSKQWLKSVWMICEEQISTLTEISWCSMGLVTLNLSNLKWLRFHSDAFSIPNIPNIVFVSHTRIGSTCLNKWTHYSEVIMGTMASQITGVSIVCSTFRSGADKRKHKSSASRWPVNSPHKGPVTWIMFAFDGIIMMKLGI